MNTKPQDRLRKAIGMIGATPATAAARLGMSRQNLHAILDGRPVRDHFAARFEKQFGISSAWILTGEGEMKVSTPSAQDAELPEFDRFPTAPKNTGSVLSTTFKVPQHFLRDLSPGLFRYVLRIDDNALWPILLKEDRLLMDGRFDLDTYKQSQFIDDRLCAVVLGDKPMLRWVRAETKRGKFVVQLLTRPKSIETTLSAAQAKGLKIVGICVGLIWRPLDSLSILEEQTAV